MTELKMADIDDEIEVFTDRSTSRDQKNRSTGIFVQDRNGNDLLEKSKPTGSICSSYDGECVARLKSINWIQMENNNEQKYAIFTDLLSLTTARKTISYRAQVVEDDQRKARQKHSQDPKIPSHVNTYGN